MKIGGQVGARPLGWGGSSEILGQLEARVVLSLRDSPPTAPFTPPKTLTGLRPFGKQQKSPFYTPGRLPLPFTFTMLSSIATSATS